MRQCKSQAVQEEWHLHWGDPCLHFQSRGKNTQGKQWRSRDFPGGPLVENLPSNSGGVDSIFGRGTKIPHALEQLSPSTTTREACLPQLEKAHMLQGRPSAAKKLKKVEKQRRSMGSLGQVTQREKRTSFGLADTQEREREGLPGDLRGLRPSPKAQLVCSQVSPFIPLTIRRVAIPPLSAGGQQNGSRERTQDFKSGPAFACCVLSPRRAPQLP